MLPVKSNYKPGYFMSRFRLKDKFYNLEKKVFTEKDKITENVLHVGAINQQQAIRLLYHIIYEIHFLGVISFSSNI